MCGFLQVLKKGIEEADVELLKFGGQDIFHRGPNDTKAVVYENAAFLFNRLSIIDLENGAQPFNYNGKYTVVFNGEIYNFKELKKELEAYEYTFETQSEVEVIGALYDKYSIDLVNKLRGMFAIVIYDKENEKVVAFRDYFGIKPLYYTENEGAIYFSSELKALKKIFPNITYNNSYLSQYATFQYIPSKIDTMFEEIKMLKPGCILEKSLDGETIITSYFNVQFNEKKENHEELKKKIKETLKESVRMHLESDVPVATFLSSGIDSSIVTKIASDINKDIVSYTIGFDVEGYDEGELAKRFADDIGIKNVGIKLDYKDYIRELPKIVYHMDSPIGDPSIIPLYYICKAVSKDYKVVLSGEGADEFFGGYNIYTEDKSLRVFDNMPDIFKKSLKGIAKKLPDTVKGKSFLMRGTTPLDERYVGNANIFNEDEKKKVLLNYDECKSCDEIIAPLFQNAKDYDNVTKRQYVDINTWLIGDILTKADRMSMANSLELRVPFVDKEVFKIGASLCKEDKINNFKTKVLLREVFRDELPEYLYEKKKLGYPVPLRVWLKDELYDFAYNIIKDNTIPEINQKEVLNMLKKHRENKWDYSRKIWNIIIYIIWYKLYIDESLDKDDIFEVN